MPDIEVGWNFWQTGLQSTHKQSRKQIFCSFHNETSSNNIAAQDGYFTILRKSNQQITPGTAQYLGTNGT